MEKIQPRPATPEELEKIRKINALRRAAQLKQRQVKQYWEDRNGETEAAIEQDRERRREE